MHDINESGSCEQFKVANDMNDSTSREQAFGCYEQLRVVDDMNYSKS